MEWTVFIMPVLEKTKQALFLSGILIFASPVLNADVSNNVEIIAASLEPEEQAYLFNAEIRFKLTPAAIEAIEHSVSLFWTVRLKLYHPRSFFWDKKILDYSIRYRLRFHALLNMYQVENMTTGETRRFFSLPVALNAMGRIRDVKVTASHEINQSRILHATLLVQFDREALPLPLRPVAYFDSQWDLSSRILEWLVQK